MKKSIRAVAAGGAVVLAAGLLAPSAQADDVRPTPPDVDNSAWWEQPAPAPAPQYAAGVVVKYKAGAEPSTIKAAANDAVGEKTSVVQVAKRTLAYSSGVVPVADAAAAAEELADRADVEWAEPNVLRQAAENPWPVPVTDPYAALLRGVWDMRDQNEANVQYVAASPWPAGGYSAKSPVLWPATNGNGVVVAVLDTGFINHPDLAPNVVPGYDMVSDPTNGNDGDGRDPDGTDPGSWRPSGICGGAANSSWHGTHVAGTIGAVANNGQGVVGVAPGVRLQSVRVLGRCGGADADIAAAIMWAAGLAVPGVPNNPTPAKVINMSLGGQGACTQVFVDAINAARGAGSTIVVALGNDGVSTTSTPYTPASCAGVVGVHATGDYGEHANYSNFGVAADVSANGGNSWLGENQGILSTVDNGTQNPTGAGYGWKDGTSMAAPVVAGMAALMTSVGQFTPDAMETALKSAVTAFPASGQSFYANCNTTQCGTGIVDATRIPAPVGAPAISGVGLPGQTLTATAPAWIGPAQSRGFTWYANGVQVGSGSSYVVSGYDIGKNIVVRDSVAGGPYAPIGANSAPVAVANPNPGGNATKKAKVKVKGPKRISVFAKGKLKVTVKVKGKKKPKGTLTIKDGKRKIGKAKLKAKKKGKITVTLPRLSLGKHKITVAFKGSGAQGKKTITIQVTRRR